MLRKRSHQAFTDLEAEEEPLSPVMHPLHQEMGAGGGSDSDGDQVMGTGESYDYLVLLLLWSYHMFAVTRNACR